MSLLRRIWHFFFPPPLQKNLALEEEEKKLKEAKEACKTLLMEATSLQKTSSALPALSTGVMTKEDLAGLRERLRKEAAESKK